MTRGPISNKAEIMKFSWMIFPKIGLDHAPKIFQKGFSSIGMFLGGKITKIAFES